MKILKKIPKKSRLQVLLIITFLLMITFRGYGNFSTNEIEPRAGFGISYSSVAWGDYDNDGDLDLAVAGEFGGGNWLRIYKNKGDGTFNSVEERVEDGWNITHCSIAWGDYDNDGYLDLAVAGRDQGGTESFRIYKNDKAGGFNGYILPDGAWGVYDCSLAWGDCDNDGDLDIAVAGYDGGGNKFRIYKNNGDGTFDTNEIEPGGASWGVSYSSLAWGDCDNDGDLDIAVAGFDGGGRRLRIYTNNGNGDFNGFITPQPVWGISQCSIAWADYDNDGDLDLAAAGNDGAGNKFRIYENDGDGNFTSFVTPETNWGVNDCSLAWGDYNNDGNLDIAVTGFDGSSRFRIYKNNGDKTFDPNEIEPEPGWGVNIGSVAWGDFNNNGKLDIAVAGNKQGTGYLRVYTNIISSNNNAPDIPAGMTSVNSNGFWRFKWDAPNDDNTPKIALRYKIAIGVSESNVYDYISTNIDYPRGQANIGNVITSTGSYYQSSIEVCKTVYWKVSAIDTAFKHSDFCIPQTTEGIDTVPPLPGLPKIESAAPSFNSITWTAEPATDCNTVYYKFEYITNSITNSSTWVTNRIFQTTNLQANTVYSMRIRTRDNKGNTNIWSIWTNAWTLPLSPDVLCSRETNRWYDLEQGSLFIFTNKCGFGIGKVAYYRYKWIKNTNYIFSGQETKWDAGILNLEHPNWDETPFYLHLKSYNEADFSGTGLRLGPYGLTITNLVKEEKILNYPNPFDPNQESTSIQWYLSMDSAVDITIYSLNGEKVIRWEFPEAGKHSSAGGNSLDWDGKNGKGKVCANGVYICDLFIRKTGKRLRIKIVIIK